MAAALALLPGGVFSDSLPFLPVLKSCLSLSAAVAAKSFSHLLLQSHQVEVTDSARVDPYKERPHG